MPIRRGNEIVTKWELVDGALNAAEIERRVRFLDEKSVANVHGWRSIVRVVDNEWKKGQCPSLES